MTSGVTDTGLRYGVKRAGFAVAYCSLSIKCGTRNEAGFPAGIAHFTEHTLFKGTSHKSARQINSYLDSLGGELNAYTTKEEIVIHATVLKEDIYKAMSLLLEIATTPTFPKKEIETERGVVTDEIQIYKDSPSEDIYDCFEERLFGTHPLAGLILGNEASVASITPEDLHSFVRKHFIPGRMALTMVADIDEKEAEARLKKISDRYFRNSTGKTGTVEAAEPVTISKFEITLNKENHETNAIIGSTAPSLYDRRKRIATILLSNILGGPASNSILNSILREKNGWVYSVETSYVQYTETGVLAIILGCDKSNLNKCLTAIHKEILKLQTIPLTATKMKAAKKQLLGQLAISSDNGESQCLSMGKSLISYGEIASDDSVKADIDSITAEEIMEMAREIFHPDKTCRLVYQ